MTYLAPRQGLFAIIILISFFIQTTLLIISTDQQLDELKKETAERMLIQLIDEVKLPLLSKDKVSLSVLTGRYTSENQVASVVIQDIDDDVLIQTGQAQLLTGDQISQSVVMNDNVIGKVTLTLRDTSKGEIIASQWMYILGSFIVHLLLWLIYGYIARPTREQLAALSRDIQDHLIEQRGPQFNGRSHRSRLLEEEGKAYNDNNLLTDDEEGHKSIDVHQAVNKYVQSHQGGTVQNSVAESEGSHALNTLNSTERDSRQNTDSALLPINPNHEGYSDGVSDAEGLHGDGGHQVDNMDNKYQQRDSIDDKAPQGLISNDESPITQGAQGATVDYQPKALMSNRSIDVATVQIRFYDPSRLIGTLAAEQSKPYFALCTQLLKRTVDELLKQPLLYGVSLNNDPTFDDSGATVEFVNSGSLSKAALAAVMLAKVFVMLNQVTYMKHRELKRFALEVYVGVSDEAVAENMQQLMRHRAEVNDVLTLLPVEGIKQLSGHVQLEHLENPTTVYERDCSVLKGTSDAMMKRLVDVRNAVLLSGQR